MSVADWELREIMNRDFKEVARLENEALRAKTAASGHRNSQISMLSSGGNANGNNNNGFWVNKVNNFPRADDEYEAFRINNDVRKHMQKFLRPTSQYALSTSTGITSHQNMHN
jgi:hypothetical protein